MCTAQHGLIAKPQAPNPAPIHATTISANEPRLQRYPECRQTSRRPIVPLRIVVVHCALQRDCDIVFRTSNY